MRYLFSLLILFSSISTIYADKLYLVCERSGSETLDIVIDPFETPSDGWEQYHENEHKTKINGKYPHLYEISKDEIILGNFWTSKTEVYRINRISGKLSHYIIKNDISNTPVTYDCNKYKDNQF